MNSQRTLTARATLSSALATSRRPCILSSFGKDSLAVIELCASFGVTRVLYLEDRDEAIDAPHIQRTIDRYGLEVTRMHSGRAVLYFIDGQSYLLGFPFVTRSLALPIPTNVDPYVPGTPFTCVDDRLRADHGRLFDYDADLLILGFKRADWESNTCRVVIDKLTDEQRAAYLTRYAPVQTLAPGVNVCYPLLDWSHNDVWDYLDERAIAASPIMYAGREKRPHQNPVCVRCHDPRGPAIVLCPKTRERIMNLGHFTQDADLSLDHLVRLGVLQPDERAVLTEKAHG